MTIIGDTPIQEPSQDRLGRAALAESLAKQIQQADLSEGLVVGVLGPWGSGKTSFVNLVRHYLTSKDVPVLRFNPWMFSGTEHLVQAFFSELSAHFRFRRELRNIGKVFDKYGEYLSVTPGVGPWAARVSLIRRAYRRVSRLWRRSRPERSPIEVTRDKIRKALIEQQTGPLVVILDDLDRLTASEIRDVFQLVRLTASFPNIIYVLAFDRGQVEKALDQDGLSGREYFEKIVQLVRDLPEISHEVMLDELTAAIGESLAGVDDPGPFDSDAWSRVLFGVVMPLVGNVRDVRRYCASIRGTVTDLQGAICQQDVLALEAIRIFAPDVFAQFRDAVEIVTSSLEPRVELDASTSDTTRQRVERIVGFDDNRREVVKALLEHVFPEGGRHLGGSMAFLGGLAREWYQQRRVANTEMFRLYLERVEGQTLGMQRLGDQAVAVMAEAEHFQGYMRSLGPETLRRVVASLETHEGHFRPEQVVSGVTVLLNVWPTMPEHRGGLFDPDNRIIVSRVVLRLLRTFEPGEEVIAAVDEILPQLETLSGQLELITIVGHKESAGSRLVSTTDAERIERSFRDRVRDATADVLAREHDLMPIMYRTSKEASASEPALVMSPDPRVTCAMLESARQIIHTTSADGRAQRTTHLSWDALTAIYGDEAVLGERIVELRAQLPEGSEVLELAEKYAGGWRPPEWPDH